LGYRVRAETIRKMGRKLNVFDPLSLSLSAAQDRFRTASIRYQAAKPNHEMLRQSFLFSRLQDPSLDDAHYRAIQKLVRLEKIRDAFRRIRALKGIKQGSSISQVEVSGPLGSQIVSDRRSVEQALCHSLQQRFTKAHGSPFLHGQLALDVDPYGCGWAAKEILEGTYVCPPDTDEYTRQFIEALKWPVLRPTMVSSILSTEAFCTHWRRAKERTSSSISGLHFGHYKAASHHPSIAHLHARFTQLVFMTGISLSRYQSGLQVILEKKPGAINIDMLRAILLIEADFNAAMKLIIGHRMICNAIRCHAIPTECFGSRPGHSAIQVSLNRCLVSDTSRQQKTPLAIASVDCLTCYDSLGHPPASIACQRLGAPPSVLCTIFSTIQLMKFFLRTAHGDSDNFYGGGTSVLPFQGVCQGNGAGPAIWLAVSMVLMNMIKSHGSSATFTTPISKLSTSLIGLIYVDDCDLFAVNSDSSRPQAVVDSLQKNINLWQGGLIVTGGALSPKKSSWCLLSMRPQGKRWLFHSVKSFPASITISDGANPPLPIRRVEPHEGIAVVGVIQALSGTQKPALAALQSKSKEWEVALRQGFLPRSLAWLALHCVIWPGLRYPLAVTSFTESQALSITCRLYQTLLPRLGVNRHYPLVLRHIPAKFYGLGLPQPYWEQGLAALKLFLEFGNTSRPESVLIQMSLELLQLEVGTGQLIFDADFSQWSLLATQCWLKSIWAFVSFAHIRLVPELSPVPALQCQNDAF